MEYAIPDSLTLDLGIYPRENLCATHVESLREAIRGGAEFPPLVIGRPGDVIVDGAHRWSAWRTELGEKKIGVVFKTYGSRTEMLLHAIDLNARHGRRLDQADYAACFEKSAKLGIARSTIVSSLMITKDLAKAVLGFHQREDMPLETKVQPASKPRPGGYHKQPSSPAARSTTPAVSVKRATWEETACLLADDLIEIMRKHYKEVEEVGWPKKLDALLDEICAFVTFDHEEIYPDNKT